MNRNHRIIWSESRNAFIVASEGAKAKGKPSSTRKVIAAAVLSALGSLAAMPVMAASSCPGGGTTVIISGAETSTCNLAAGDSLIVTNTGSINTVSNLGVFANSINVGNINNSGSISGAQIGIYLNISTMTGGINNSGTITGNTLTGIRLTNSTIGSITNSGTISGPNNAGIVLKTSTITDGITNSGTISGDNLGIWLTHTTIGSITNETGGTISGRYAIQMSHGSTVGSITNNGTISGDYAIMITDSTVGDIINNGTLESTDNTAAIYLSSNSTVGSITNNGTISGRTGLWISNSSTISGGIINTGTISGTGNGTAIAIYSASTVGSISNSGTISGGFYGVRVNDSTLTSITNSGTISGSGEVGIRLQSGSTVGSITNDASGSIYGGDTGIRLTNSTISGSITNNGTISGESGGISVSNSSTIGSITNNGTISASSSTGVRLNSGSTIGSITNSGTISGTQNAIYISSDSHVTGGITNTGSIISNVVLNDATLNLNGTTGSVAGNVEGNAGSIVNVNGTFTTGGTFNVDTFNIASGGVLNMGHGVTTTSGFNNVGTLAVANGVTAAITGDYTQSANGVFQTTATNDISFGKLTVSGTAAMAAGTGIHVNATSGNTLAVGNTLASVISAGSLSASTFTVTDNSFLFNFTAVINGNAVDLVTEKGLSVLDSVTTTGFNPGRGAAVVLDGFMNSGTTGSDRDNVVTALGQLNTVQQVSDAVAQTLPLMTGSIIEANKAALHGISLVVQARQDANKGLSSGDAFLGDRNFWLKPLGSWIDQDNRKGVSGFSANTYGLIGGIDAEISDTTLVGLALAYTHTDVDGNSSVAANSAHINSYHGIVYGSYSFDERTELNLQADVGRNDHEGSRAINFGGLSRVARSDFDSWSGHVGAQLSRSYALSPRTTLVPLIRADYTYIRAESYTEKNAGALNLAVDSTHADELILMAGGRVAHNVADNAMLVANLGVGYDVLADRNSITAAYTGGGAAFTTRGLDPSPALVRGGVGFVVSNIHALEITARYDFEVRKDFDNQTASLKFRLPF